MYDKRRGTSVRLLSNDPDNEAEAQQLRNEEAANQAKENTKRQENDDKIAKKAAKPNTIRLARLEEQRNNEAKADKAAKRTAQAKVDSDRERQAEVDRDQEREKRQVEAAKKKLAEEEVAR